VLVYTVKKSTKINANLNITKRGIPIESSIDLQETNNNKDYYTINGTILISKHARFVNQTLISCCCQPQTSLYYNHKHICPSRTSKPAPGAVSAAAT